MFSCTTFSNGTVFNGIIQKSQLNILVHFTQSNFTSFESVRKLSVIFTAFSWESIFLIYAGSHKGIRKNPRTSKKMSKEREEFISSTWEEMQMVNKHEKLLNFLNVRDAD